MSKNALVVAVKPAKKLGWCLFLNGEPYAVGSLDYCRDVSRELIVRYLQYGPDSMPVHVGSKGGAA